MAHNEARLPRWAQELLEQLRQDNMILAKALETTRNIHAITSEPHREWFAIPGPAEVDANLAEYKLWFFARNHPVHLATLFKGDVLFVGRAYTGWIDKIQSQYMGEINGRLQMEQSS